MAPLLRLIGPFTVLVLGCHGALGPGGATTLAGVTLPLVSSPAMRAVVQGSIDGRAAEISFDPGQSVSFVTGPCVPSPRLVGQVAVPDAFGPEEPFPLSNVGGLRVGGTLFRRFDAAVASGKDCVVVLGAPELRGLAIELDPVRREVRLRASQSRERWAADAEASGDDVQVLALTQEPRFDWPLLPVRIRQGSRVFDATFMLSLRDARSRVFDAPARDAGLRPGLELLDGLPLPDGVTLPAELARLKGYAWEAFELAPGFGLSTGSLEIEPGSPPHVVQGVLGADVWGRFFTTWDTGSNVLVLRRPRVFVSGSRVQCARGGVTSDEACFEVHSTAAKDGVEVTAMVWRPLPDGARLSFDLAGGTGGCHVGITFGPGDRGRSSHHHFPWPTLAHSSPACAEALRGVTAVSPGFLDESPLRECPGVCGWARDAVSGRLACECQPSARTGDLESERRLLELFKRALQELKEEKEREPD